MTYPEVRRGHAGEAPVPSEPRDPHRPPGALVLLRRTILASVREPAVVVAEAAGGHGRRG